MKRHPREAWSRRHSRVLVVSDLLTLAWAFSAAHVVWAANPAWRGRHQPFHPVWMIVSLVLLLVWMAALTAADTRDPRAVGIGPDEYKRIVNSTVFVFAVIAFFGYAAKIQVPRSYVLVTLPLGLLLLILTRWCWRQWLLFNRQNGRMTLSVLAVGSPESVRHLISNLHRNPQAGYQVTSVCVTDHESEREGSIDGVPVLGGVGNLAASVISARVDAVVVTASDIGSPELVRRLGWDLEGHDVDLIVAPALANIAGPRVHARPVAGLPLLHIERPAYQGTQRWLKAAFDRVGSVMILILVSPLVAVIAMAAARSSKGPVFFAQERAGRDGKSFRMYKFRTMVVNADQMLDELEPDAGNAFMFKVKEDPRVTRLGRFLRRYSLDELPQFVNVLKGDMSLVGPRPPLLSEVEGYEFDSHRRLLVKPGITGPWQISGRSTLNWEETIRLDLYYVENWSMVGDLVILWRTARAVLSSRGAY